MGTASIHFESLSRRWLALFQQLVPQYGRRECIHGPRAWRRLRRRPSGSVFQGCWYCTDHCLERALTDATRRLRSVSRRAPAPHRIPLGLLLLSRQQLTVEQLRVSLEAQRAAGHGRIGEWFQTLGFVSEQQVTAALARQWSCPVLRPNSIALGCEHTAEIPITLLESCVMIPLNDVDSTATLHIAFGDSIDYSALYAIERMLGCHTDACLAAPSLVHKSLQV